MSGGDNDLLNERLKPPGRFTISKLWNFGRWIIWIVIFIAIKEITLRYH